MSQPPLTFMASLRYDLVDRLLDEIGPVDSILEMGCGQGAVGARLAARARYLGVEPDPQSRSVAAERVAPHGGRVLLGDVSVVPPDEQFGLVCAFEVLEHIEDDLGALKEWRARVAPGGWLMLSVPAFQQRYGAMDELVGHYRRYDPPALVRLLDSAGFVQPRAELYGFPLGYLLEAGRNVIARRRLGRAPTSMAERSGASGRTFQPPPSLTTAVAVATAPFRVAQRPFRRTGTGVVAVARRGAA